MANKYGYIYAPITEPDYLGGFNSPLPKEILAENGDWTPWLVQKEFQNLNNIEPYACVSFTILNQIEIYIKRKYGEERNYSDRFLSAISGTKEGGNSPQVVYEFLRKIGVVEQDKWPFDNTIDTFDKFYSKIPPKLYELAREFNEEWNFKHEYVPVNWETIEEYIKYSPLLISVYAWISDAEGYYFRPQGQNDIHATTAVKIVPLDYLLVFDSYENPHLKKIRWDSLPQTIKRIWLEKKPKKQKSFWGRILEALIKFYNGQR